MPNTVLPYKEFVSLRGVQANVLQYAALFSHWYPEDTERELILLDGLLLLYYLYYEWAMDPRLTVMQLEIEERLSWNYELDPADPVCILVCHHEPGLDQFTESFYIAPFSSLLNKRNLNWMTRIIGKPFTFWSIGEIPDFHLNICRDMYISNSFLGSGKAVHARRILRECVPVKYGPLIQHARRMKNRPKYRYLEEEWFRLGIAEDPKSYLGDYLEDHGYSRGTKLNQVKRSIWPDWYNQKSKDEINYELWTTRFADRLAGIEKYIDPYDFWCCATGQVHPYEVESYIKKHSRKWHDLQAKELQLELPMEVQNK